MTLIERMMVPCTRLYKAGISDGAFGRANTWAPADSFMAAIIRKETDRQTEADRPDMEERYWVVVPTGVSLGFHEAFRRDSDGACFQVLGDTRDTEAPAMSSVQIAKVEARRWKPV
jgi:hypothetical protein